MKKQSILKLFTVVVILLLGFFVYKNYKKVQVEPILETTVENSQESAKNSSESLKSFITKTSDSNVNLYTSPTLGLKFKYALFDPMYPPAGEVDYYGNITPPPKNIIMENGNEITTTGGGVVKVFSKDPKVSLEDEIKNKFNASNCKIIIDKSSDYFGTKARIYYPDMSDGKGGTEIKSGDNLGDFSFSEKDKKCLNENTYTPRYFAMNDKYPDRYIGLEYSTQAPEAVLYFTKDRHVVTWMSTIEFTD